MRPVLRSRQLSIRQTWCQPRSRSHATSLRLEDAQAFSAANAAPAEPEAGPSRIRDPFLHLEKTFFTPSTPTSRHSNIVFRYQDEAHLIQQLRDHLNSRSHFDYSHSRQAPYASRANRTWKIYAQISPPTRRSLPLETLRSVLVDIVPIPLRKDWSTPFGPGEHVARTFADRITAVIMDMRSACGGIEAVDGARALAALSMYGSVNVVERLYAQLVRLHRDMVIREKEELLRIRMHTIVERARKIRRLSTAGPHAETKRKESYFDRPRIPAQSARGAAISTEGEEIMTTLWLIMKEFQSVALPLRNSLSAVSQSLNLVRDLAKDHEFAKTLDGMMYQMLRDGHTIDLPLLQKVNPFSEYSLKTLDRNTVNALMGLFARQGETYKMMALTELFHSPRWARTMEEISGQFAGVELRQTAVLEPTEAAPSTPIAEQDADDDFGPTLSGETAAFNAQRKETDAFGRSRKVSVVGEMLHDVRDTLSSVGSDIPAIDEFTSVPTTGAGARRYEDFDQSRFPTLRQIQKSASQVYDTFVSRETIPVSPKPTVWRNIDMDTWSTCFEHVRDAGDVAAAVLLARTYIDLAQRQQAYWVYRTLVEYHRQAAIKRTKESVQDGSLEAEADVPPAKGLQWGLKLRGNSVDDFVWPRDIAPPMTQFHVDYLTIPLNMARATSGKKVLQNRIQNLLKEVTMRLRDEHRILAGREPSENRLELDEYVTAMRQAPRLSRGKETIGEMLFFAEAKNAWKSEYDVMSHLHRVDQTHRRLKEVLEHSIGARVHKREKKMRARERRALRGLQMEEQEEALAKRQEEDKRIFGTSVTEGESSSQSA